MQCSNMSGRVAGPFGLGGWDTDCPGKKCGLVACCRINGERVLEACAGTHSLEEL